MTVTKWRLTDKNIPVSERTFNSREDALYYLSLAWSIYPDMQRVRLSKFDIETEVIRRPVTPAPKPEEKVDEPDGGMAR